MPRTPSSNAAVRHLRLGIFLLSCLVFVPFARAYSVLSHEEVVDMAWNEQIVPLLKARFPDITAEQMKEAHSFAYGGSVIQDIGYYPFGDHDFSDLLHYVRTGEFVGALLRDAATPDELAFALGALAHYYGDTIGHPIVNQITADEYPQLKKRFGRSVTYSNDSTAHLRTEFGFDVVEVAHGNYSQENYRDFIGFQVSKPLLERAFLETYGLPLKAVMKHEELAVSTYRYCVSSLIPKMTHVALASYHEDIAKARPGFDQRKFEYRLRRTEFEKQYGKQYARPGFGAHVLALVLRLVPKVGPFKALALKLPNADEQTQYLKSINLTEDAYRAMIVRITASKAGPPPLPELDFDTGKPIAEGEYPLCDQAYGFLVQKLAEAKDAQMSGPVLADVQAFYADAGAKDALRAQPKKWVKVQAALGVVRGTPVVAAGVVK